METPKVNRWTIRPRFILALIAFLGLIGWFVSASMKGGQASTSPNERYRALVMRKLNPWASDPYDFTIQDLTEKREVIRFQIIPVNGKPSQDTREGTRIFEWSSDSQQLKITLDEKLWGTISLAE